MHRPTVILRASIACLSVAALVTACARNDAAGPSESASASAPASAVPTTVPSVPISADGKVHLSEAEWKARLTPEQYHILREQGTEPAFHNAYFDNHAKGTYVCAGCGLELFSSESKFDSGTGWPSFWQPIRPDAVERHADNDPVFPRTEVHCPRCGGHLGHVFDDGPKPTGLRYCIDSAALVFVPAK